MPGGKKNDGRGPSPGAVVSSLQSTGELIVRSRLLVLQSKRILLASVAKKLAAHDNSRLRARAEALEESAEQAYRDYRKAVLTWASPDTAQFWLVSYMSMIEGAEELVIRLHAASDELPDPDHSQMEADIVRLDQIIKRWRENVAAEVGRAAIA